MTFKPEKPQEPEPKPGVEVGDSLYVHHQGQPCTGKVAAHGRHGVTVEIGGKHHKIKWDKVLGHKQRIQQRYTIIDQGEDGMLVEDANGQRRFIAMPNDSKEDPMVAKAARPVLLFTKSEPGAGAPPGPGLQKKQITDKNGVQTTKWVRVDRNGPPAQRGQHVGFENGEHRGHGEVIASGKHGVTVQDGAKGIHRVHHDKVTHHWEGDGAPTESPHQEADQPERQTRDPHNGAEAIAHALFNTSELDKLPEKAPQPVNSWDELETKGKQGLEEFKDMLGKVAQSLGLETGKRPQSYDHAVAEEKRKAGEEKRDPKELNQDDYMLPEHWDNDKGFLFMGPLKSKDRAEEKVRTDYKGDWSQLRDMVRATIAVPAVTQIPKVLAELKAAGIELAQKPKNNLVKPLPGGYRDLNMIVKLPNGLLAELQVHVKPMTLAKEKGHKPYETTRSIEGKYKEKGLHKDKTKWDPADREAHEKAMSEQEKMYGEAWDRATKPTSGKSSKLTKSLDQPMMILLNFKGV